MNRRESSDSLAARLRRLRTERGLSQRALARAAGLSYTAVQHIESGRKQPLVETARRLAQALGVAVGELVR